MMSKMQKMWVWIFGAMFVVPEVLFLFTPLSLLSILGNFSQINLKPLLFFFVNPQFFADNPFYLFLALAFEWVGVLGLLILSIKFSKKILILLLGIFITWLLFLTFLSYAVINMGF